MKLYNTSPSRRNTARENDRHCVRRHSTLNRWPRRDLVRGQKILHSPEVSGVVPSQNRSRGERSFLPAWENELTLPRIDERRPSPSSRERRRLRRCRPCKECVPPRFNFMAIYRGLPQAGQNPGLPRIHNQGRHRAKAGWIRHSH